MGPADCPPSESDAYSAPMARPARSVHCTAGALARLLTPRALKLEPDCVRIWNCAPLKPPFETSQGEVASVERVAASRGTSPPPNERPLSVAPFWSPPRPKTEN